MDSIAMMLMAVSNSAAEIRKIMCLKTKPMSLKYRDGDFFHHGCRGCEEFPYGTVGSFPGPITVRIFVNARISPLHRVHDD